MISVILNVYKRPYTLEKQIESILSQSVEIKPENIHVWYNNVDGLEQPLPVETKIKTYKCNYNTKFFGRFTIPLICQTPYIAMFDDDVIPGKKWFENCLSTIDKHNAILGASGVITNGKTYVPNQKVGWNGIKNDKPREVDLVGHGWFYKKEWGKFMWLEEPPSWDNGEDMFFSYVAQKNGIKTIVPPHPIGDVELWGNNPNLDNNWGVDRNAHSLTVTNHLGLRNKIVKDLKTKGWKTIK